MNKQVSQQNIPNGWRETNLGSIADLYQPQTISKEQMSPEGKYLVFGANGVIGKYEKFNHEDSEVIVTCRGASCGSISMTPKQAWITGNAMVVKVKEEEIMKPYVYYFLKNSDLNSVISGGAQPQITRQPISAYKILFPKSKTEQQKIAEILGTVDEDIAKTQEVIEATEKLKRGLMQQLFTRGLGHTKFKETKIGQIPEEWEVGELGSYLLRNPDYGINAAGVDYTKELPTYIRITDISDDGKFISENKKSVDHKDSENYLLQKGDLLFARTGASVGKTYLYNPNDGNLVFAGFLIRVRTDKRKMLAQYLSYFVQTSMYWSWVRVMSTRSGQPGINGNEYAGMVIPVPPLLEQEKYIEILSAVDEKISVNKKLKEKLTLLKKGLMQDLLSGKVRTIIN